jgi:hypothetical protein
MKKAKRRMKSEEGGRWEGGSVLGEAALEGMTRLGELE